MSKNFYITTPIYYPSAKPHMGHAYSSIVADFFARIKRIQGYNVFFLTGTDEHGQKIQRAAEKANKDPLKFCDEISKTFKDLSSILNLSNDDFIRTTEKRHFVSVENLWNILEKKGEIYLSKYAGWYSVSDEAFYNDDEIDTVDGKKICKSSGSPVEWVEEESFFFKLSKWQDKLLKFYSDNPKFILPETRKNEVISFVKSGLKDLSISRKSFSWGIKVPSNKDHVIYVWLDALTNYLSALNYPDEKNNLFKNFWPANIHLIGKDILRFHAVYWPAFLMAADLPLPKRVYAHGWWTNDGQKISKSLGNAIDPNQLAATYGLDQTRYFLMREVPFGNDGDFSVQAMTRRINGDLANDLGNLSQRVLSMVFKNCDGIMPARPEPLKLEDKELLERVDSLLIDVRRHIDNQAFHEALRTIWRVISQANRYVDAIAPWALKKTDPVRMGEVLAVLAETIRKIAILVQPVMPDSAGKILDQLGVDQAQRDFNFLVGEARLSSGQGIAKPEPIFPRFVDEG